MDDNYNLFNYLTSFLYPVKIERKSGKYLPQLEVTLRKGKLVLDGKKVNYSYGSLHEIFRSSFKQYNLNEKPLESVLILGFGAGSVANILRNELKMNCKITGVEIDPVVIEFSKKYFGTDELSNTTIFCQDAYSYLKNDPNKYDLIVIDLFVEERVPIQFAKKEFIELLKSHLTPDGHLFYNRITNSPFSLIETTDLIEKMRVVLNSEVSVVSFEKNETSNSVLVYHNYGYKNPNIKLKRRIERMSV